MPAPRLRSIESMDESSALARHAETVATVRAFAAAAGADLVVLIVDRGELDSALMVECSSGGEVELVDGDTVTTVPAETPIAAPPRAIPELQLHAIPGTAIAVDPGSGELSAPVGAIDQLVDGLRTLAGAFGGRSVATAEFPTSDPELPITIAARAGEPAVLAAGGEEFLLP